MHATRTMSLVVTRYRIFIANETKIAASIWSQWKQSRDSPSNSPASSITDVVVVVSVAPRRDEMLRHVDGELALARLKYGPCTRQNVAMFGPTGVFGARVALRK